MKNVGITTGKFIVGLVIAILVSSVVSVGILTQLNVGPQGEQGLGAPDYDSGWVKIIHRAGKYFNLPHNLNSTDIIVDITGKTTQDSEAHQRNLGLTGDTSGLRFEKNYGGAYTDYGNSLVQTSDGGYAIAGMTRSVVVGANVYLIETDAVGNMMWNATYGGNNYDSGNSLIQTDDGGYAIAGDFTVGVDFSDVYLVKTTAEFGLAWTDSTANTITLYKGATDIYWNYVRVRIWKTD